jgi:acetoin utilization deacetylase AcuC-like enzyme
VLIVDLDVHQGDGTAAILAGEDYAWTLSLHGRNNFPFRKARSRQDVELADRTRDTGYLSTLAIALPLAIERSRPDLAIYLAGADPYEGDRLGRLALTKAGLAARDACVFDSLREHGIPVAVTMAGGYADEIDDVVDIHFATVCAALERFGSRPPHSARRIARSLA